MVSWVLKGIFLWVEEATLMALNQMSKVRPQQWLEQSGIFGTAMQIKRLLFHKQWLATEKLYGFLFWLVKRQLLIRDKSQISSNSQKVAPVSCFPFPMFPLALTSGGSRTGWMAGLTCHMMEGHAARWRRLLHRHTAQSPPTSLCLAWDGGHWALTATQCHTGSPLQAGQGSRTFVSPPKLRPGTAAVCPSSPQGLLPGQGSWEHFPRLSWNQEVSRIFWVGEGTRETSVHSQHLHTH